MGNLKMKIEKKIGKRTYEFTVEGESLFDAVIESKKLSFYDVNKCGCCGSDDLILDAHIATKFKYTTIKCNSCRASVNFGRQQDDDNIFYLRTREKADGSGKEIDWNPFPTDKSAPPQQVAKQQVNNYTQSNQTTNRQ